MAVKIDDALLLESGPAEAAEMGPQHATVQEDRGCVDLVTTIEGRPIGTIGDLSNGQATGLPAGTPLHRFNGFAATERLIAVTEGQRLVELRRVPPSF